MHLETSKTYKRAYLRLVTSKWGTSKKGNPTCHKQIVLNLGAIDQYDDGKPDFLKRLRESFSAGKPLIKQLEPYVGQKPPPETRVAFKSGDGHCKARLKRVAPCIIDPIFEALGLDQLFTSIKFQMKIKFDLLGIVRLLVYGRLLDPCSKRASMAQNDLYYRPPVKSTNDSNVYDALDIIHDNMKQVFQRMNTNITRGLGRKVDTVFYDVTNFFFETEYADADILNEKGEVVETGTRKHGVSKENRKQPIVQLGLFMDNNGIPVSFGMFPGNTLDHHTFRPAMRETIDTLEMSRFILIADRGMYSGTNMCHVLDAGNGYIVSKSLRKSTGKEIKWALSPEGYNHPSADFRCKSRIVKRTVIDENKKEREIEEKIVVYWSKAYYTREYKEHESFLKFIDKLKANPAGFRITASQSKSLQRFLKKDVLNKESGEVLDGTKLVGMIDDDKLNQFKELMGYYQIASSELSMADSEIIEKYHGLTQIEDQFREMKSTLETRPIYVRTKEHIYAHLAICFISLVVMRIIQLKTKQVLGDEYGKDLNWTYGLPGGRLVKALHDWQVNELPDGYYQFTDDTGEDIQLLHRAFGISVENKLYTKGEIQKLKSAVTAF